MGWSMQVKIFEGSQSKENIEMSPQLNRNTLECNILELFSKMSEPPYPFNFDVDVDLGIATFFLLMLCLFLMVSVVRCVQMVMDPYSAISTTTYQEEQTD
ncbi:hypothetical protein JZ751_008306 [Albula glossodonta]|uniref:Uncharacterized protein n=1 Tax=Albula glossodonta TaxID=121402 RepID=A0A8T2N2L1_9TELE|nr:hypothetical protein JZ751_008306 [Albula glossodonta]